MILVHRGEQLGAQQQFQQQLADNATVELRLGTVVTRFIGERRLEAAQLAPSGRDGPAERLDVDAALVRIGWRSNSEGLPPEWLDGAGHVRCDCDGRVRGEARCFAAGDILGRISPSVATAFGSGCSAARAAVHLLDREIATSAY